MLLEIFTTCYAQKKEDAIVHSELPKEDPDTAVDMEQESFPPETTTESVPSLTNLVAQDVQNTLRTSISFIA